MANFVAITRGVAGGLLLKVILIASAAPKSTNLKVFMIDFLGPMP